MTKKSEIKLLGAPASPYVTRVRIALNLKSIEYEYVDENLACKSKLLLTSNPVHEKVPVLLHANKPPICESLVIIEYLNEIKPDVHRLLPSNAVERADRRFWAHYIDNKVFDDLSLFQANSLLKFFKKDTLLSKIFRINSTYRILLLV